MIYIPQKTEKGKSTMRGHTEKVYPTEPKEQRRRDKLYTTESREEYINSIDDRGEKIYSIEDRGEQIYPIEDRGEEIKPTEAKGEEIYPTEAKGEEIFFFTRSFFLLIKKATAIFVTN
jgi:hypothetical protein